MARTIFSDPGLLPPSDEPRRLPVEIDVGDREAERLGRLADEAPVLERRGVAGSERAGEALRRGLVLGARRNRGRNAVNAELKTTTHLMCIYASPATPPPLAIEPRASPAAQPSAKPPSAAQRRWGAPSIRPV